MILAISPGSSEPAEKILEKLLENDGADSGIDADTVDGRQATELMGLTDSTLGTDSDPDDFTAGYAITKHANTPYSAVWWLIQTMEEHSAGKRAQMAFRVDSTIRVYYRMQYGTAWTSWERLNNDGYSQISTITAAGTWTITGCTIGRPLILTTQLHTVGEGRVGYRVTSGATSGYTADSSYIFCLSASTTGVNASGSSAVIIPTATTVVISVTTLNNMYLYAYT